MPVSDCSHFLTFPGDSRIVNAASTAVNSQAILQAILHRVNICLSLWLGLSVNTTSCSCESVILVGLMHVYNAAYNHSRLQLSY